LQGGFGDKSHNRSIKWPICGRVIGQPSVFKIYFLEADQSNAVFYASVVVFIREATSNISSSGYQIEH
jgi:hypothetical protein